MTPVVPSGHSQWPLIRTRTPARRKAEDVAHQRRNLDVMLGLVKCVAGFPGIRRSLVLGDRWRALKMPTLFIWGDRDRFGPPEEGEAIAARNPNLELVRIPGAGHLPWLDDGERVVDEIERFLGRPRAMS